MTQINNTTDKAKSPPLPQHLRALLSQPLDVKLHLVQHHMELARLLVHEILEEEVTQRAGDRYSRDKPFQGRYSRWGKNPGSVRIGQEKVPIEVPRLVDKHTGETFAPESYQVLHGVLSGYGRKPATSQGWLQKLALQDLDTIQSPPIKTMT